MLHSAGRLSGPCPPCDTTEARNQGLPGFARVPVAPAVRDAQHAKHLKDLLEPLEQPPGAVLVQRRTRAATGGDLGGGQVARSPSAVSATKLLPQFVLPALLRSSMHCHGMLHIRSHLMACTSSMNSANACRVPEFTEFLRRRRFLNHVAVALQGMDGNALARPLAPHTCPHNGKHADTTTCAPRQGNHKTSSNLL